MDERSTQQTGTERPISAPGANTDAPGPPHLSDPRALTILTTEHWSLLTARSLVYNEAFSRAGMFLTFLTGTLVALGFVSQGSGYTQEFLLLATVLLGFDLFIGLATLGRISSASAEEIRALQGMNRLRHAYLEMVPTLEPYFSTSTHDDLQGILSIYGSSPDRPSLFANFAHGMTTTPGMVGTITAAVGGAFAAAFALLIGGTPTGGVVVGLATFAILTVAIWLAALRQFHAIDRQIRVRFPSPPPSGSDAPGQLNARPRRVMAAESALTSDRVRIRPRCLSASAPPAQAFAAARASSSVRTARSTSSAVVMSGGMIRRTLT